MYKILLVILISIVSSNDLIILGDVRMEEMANVLFGVEYSHLYYSYYYTYHDFISTTEPVS